MFPIYLATARGPSNYKVDVSVKMIVLRDGKSRIVGCDLRAVLDRGAAPMVIRLRALPAGVQVYGLDDAPLLIDAQRKAITLAGVVRGWMRMGEAEYEINALVVDELSVDLLIDTQFIDKHVHLINSRHRIVVMNRGEEVPLIAADNSSAGHVFVVEGIEIPPKCEAVVRVKSQARGLCLVTGLGRRDAAVANGLHELDSGSSFLMKVGNFGTRSVTLTPGTVIAYAEVYSENLVLNVEDQPSKNPAEWEGNLDLEVLTENQRDVFRKVLREYSHLWDQNRLGVLQGTVNRIETQGNPVFQHPYRAGAEARKAEKEEVARMLRLGVIEPSQAEWASPVVLIPKSDGSIRFCIDYTRINALTAREVYPLPRMDECLDSLGEAEYFSTLDANTGFWQIEVCEKERDKATFSCHSGMYRFKRMPFGLVNAPATFQKAMDNILADLRWESVIVYLDDVIIFSRSFEEHVRHLTLVLQKLSEAGATLKFSKCQFFRRSVDYLGHRILPHKLQVLAKYVESIAKAVEPTKKTQVRSFLGLCGIYHRFVPNYAAIAKPLTNLTKKGAAENFVLTETEQKAFGTLKARLISAPTLSLPRECRNISEF
jgi:hypothetical protein